MAHPSERSAPEASSPPVPVHGRSRWRWVDWLAWLLLAAWVVEELVDASSGGSHSRPMAPLAGCAFVALLLAYGVYAIACPTWMRWATVATLSASCWLVPEGAALMRSHLLERTQENGTLIAEALVRHKTRTGHYPQALEDLVPAELPEGIPQPCLLDETWHYREDRGFRLTVWTAERQCLEIGPDLQWQWGYGG